MNFLKQINDVLHDPVYGRLISAFGLALLVYAGKRLGIDMENSPASQAATISHDGVVVGAVGSFLAALGFPLTPKPRA